MEHGKKPPAIDLGAPRLRLLWCSKTGLQKTVSLACLPGFKKVNNRRAKRYETSSNQETHAAFAPGGQVCQSRSPSQNFSCRRSFVQGDGWDGPAFRRWVSFVFLLLLGGVGLGAQVLEVFRTRVLKV